MQQGRVQIDADWNEQMDIQAHYQRTFLENIIGKNGTPFEKPGFEISIAGNEYYIGCGYYFVDGLLIQNNCKATGLREIEQPDLPDFQDRSSRIKGDSGFYIVYLDVWERHITALDDPSIREVALGGSDTATRTKVIWQAKVKRFNYLEEPIVFRQGLFGSLQAFGYEGLENQLYRVEIHDGGKLDEATFKWSRDNGTTVNKISSFDVEKGSINLEEPVDSSHFTDGQWVEISDDCHELWGLPGSFVQIKNVNGATITFNLTTITNDKPITLTQFPKNPKIRRWDSIGLLRVGQMNSSNSYIELEKGIQIKFGPGTYQTGDYWLIPARAVIRDVEWPKNEGTNEPLQKKQERVEHHFCKLALLKFDKPNNKLEIVRDYRKFFSPIVSLQQTVPTTGIVSIDLPKVQHEVVSYPIKHFLKDLTVPPFVFLDQNTIPISDVKLLETQKTLNNTKHRIAMLSNKIVDSFPCNVNIETFQIKFRPPFERGKILFRWWAIPAANQETQQTKAT